MAEEKGVKGENSPSSKPSQTPSDQGNDSSKGDERGVSWENRAKEYERKLNETNVKLQELSEAKTELEDRLVELEEKTYLSSSEKHEKEDIESKIAELERSEKTKPWLGLMDRELQKSSGRTKFDISLMMMDDFIETQAESLKIKPEDLEKELNKYAVRYREEGKLPHQRAKLSMRDYLENLDYQKRKSDLEKREQEEKTFRETGIRVAETENSLRSQIKQASQSKSNSDWEKIVSQL